jgi:hypothetical protein
MNQTLASNWTSQLPAQVIGGVESHPDFFTFTDFQQPYSLMAPASQSHYGNNVSTSASNYAGEFPLNSNNRYAGGFLPRERYLSLFADKSLRFMSQQITRLLAGVHPQNKNIVVPDSTIYSVADSVYQNTGQSTEVMQQMVINYIVDSIKTEYENTAKNNALTIWVTKYDQETGMKQFNDVKLNNKMRRSYMQWKY